MKKKIINLLTKTYIITYPIIAASILTLIIIEQKNLKLTISLIILMSGAFLNVLAIISNKFKMPVENPGNNYKNKDTFRHFYFDDKKKIKFYYLSDIFSLFISKTSKLNKGTMFHFSIGDVLIIIGVIFTLIVWI